MAIDNFYIDIENSSGVKQGGGPITSAASWSYTARVDRAGSFSFTMPASDSMADIVAKKLTARAYALLGGVWTEVGAGVIDVIQRDVQADGTVVLGVSGDDELRELTYRSVGFQQLESSGAPITHAAALAILDDYAPSGWTFTADASPGYDNIYGAFAGESLLGALVWLGNRSETHFYRSGARAVTFASTFTDSGIRAIQARGVLADDMCAIVGLNELQNSYELISRVYPYGAGQGQARLTLAASDWTPPSGYSISTTDNYVKHDATETAYGRIERYLEYKDVAPISNTDADLEAAANYLARHAYRELYTRINWMQYPEYRLQLAQCDALLRPLQSVRVVYRDDVQNIDIDDDLYILESTIQVDSSGLRTTDLVVSGYDVIRQSATDVVTDNMAQGMIFQAHPQLNANSYTTGYTKNVDGDYDATFRFRFGSEVVQLQQVLFEFQLLPFESTVTSVGSTQVTTSASQTATTAVASGSHSHTYTYTIPGHSHTYTYTISGHSHTFTYTIPAHTHTITIAAHTHTVPNHTHYIPISAQSGSVNSVNLSTGGGSTGTLGHGSENFSTSPVYVLSDSSTGTTTSESGGGETITATASSSSSGSTTTTTSQTATGSTTTTTSQTATGASAQAGGEHTHTITIPAHTHTFTPTLEAVYGIFREESARTYSIRELNYRVNSGSWTDLNTDAVDIGSDWYQLDITDDVMDSDTYRPVQTTNTLEIRSFGFSATCAVDGLNVVTIYAPGLADIISIGDEVEVTGTTNYDDTYTVAQVYDIEPDNVVDFDALSADWGMQACTAKVLFKTVTIDGLLSVRNIIQAIAYT